MFAKVTNSLVFSALLFISAAAAGEELETKWYALSNYGSIQLTAPKSWQGDVPRQQGSRPPTIMFSSGNSPPFGVLMTPLAVTEGDKPLPTLQDIERKIEQMVEAVKPVAAEKDIPIAKLSGAFAKGYYFSVTDKAPKPGEYKYMTQGIAQFDDLALGFTVLTNADHQEVVRQALAILETAAHKIDKISQAHRPLVTRPDAIQVSKQGNDYLLNVPVSRLLLKIPGNGLSQKPISANGATSNPRYFYLESTETNLIVSGWFEPSNGFSSIETLWAEETQAWRKGNLPEPSDVLFKQFGNWTAVVYDIDTQGQTHTHIRAHWVQAGTWIDIHLSIPESPINPNPRAKLESILGTITVIEKQ